MRNLLDTEHKRYPYGVSFDAIYAEGFIHQITENFNIFIWKSFCLIAHFSCGCSDIGSCIPTGTPVDYQIFWGDVFKSFRAHFVVLTRLSRRFLLQIGFLTIGVYNNKRFRVYCFKGGFV